MTDQVPVDEMNDASLTREAIRDELGAQNAYDAYASNTSDEHAKDVYEDIKREEGVHAGELAQVLSEQDPNAKKDMAEGAEEAKTMKSFRDIYSERRGAVLDKAQGVEHVEKTVGGTAPIPEIPRDPTKEAAKIEDSKPRDPEKFKIPVKEKPFDTYTNALTEITKQKVLSDLKERGYKYDVKSKRYVDNNGNYVILTITPPSGTVKMRSFRMMPDGKRYGKKVEIKGQSSYNLSSPEGLQAYRDAISKQVQQALGGGEPYVDPRTMPLDTGNAGPIPKPNAASMSTTGPTVVPMAESPGKRKIKRTYADYVDEAQRLMDARHEYLNTNAKPYGEEFTLKEPNPQEASFRDLINANISIGRDYIGNRLSEYYGLPLSQVSYPYFWDRFGKFNVVFDNPKASEGELPKFFGYAIDTLDGSATPWVANDIGSKGFPEFGLRFKDPNRLSPADNWFYNDDGEYPHFKPGKDYETAKLKYERAKQDHDEKERRRAAKEWYDRLSDADKRFMIEFGFDKYDDDYKILGKNDAIFLDSDVPVDDGTQKILTEPEKVTQKLKDIHPNSTFDPTRQEAPPKRPGVVPRKRLGARHTAEKKTNDPAYREWKKKNNGNPNVVGRNNERDLKTHQDTVVRQAGQPDTDSIKESASFMKGRLSQRKRQKFNEEQRKAYEKRVDKRLSAKNKAANPKIQAKKEKYGSDKEEVKEKRQARKERKAISNLREGEKYSTEGTSGMLGASVLSNAVLQNERNDRSKKTSPKKASASAIKKGGGKGKGSTQLANEQEKALRGQLGGDKVNDMKRLINENSHNRGTGSDDYVLTDDVYDFFKWYSSPLSKWKAKKVYPRQPSSPEMGVTWQQAGGDGTEAHPQRTRRADNSLDWVNYRMSGEGKDIATLMLQNGLIPETVFVPGAFDPAGSTAGAYLPEGAVFVFGGKVVPKEDPNGHPYFDTESGQLTKETVEKLKAGQPIPGYELWLLPKKNMS